MKNTKNTTKPTIKKNEPQIKKETQVKSPSKKQGKKLTRVQYEELRQIEWVPFDPYAD